MNEKNKIILIIIIVLFSVGYYFYENNNIDSDKLNSKQNIIKKSLNILKSKKIKICIKGGIKKKGIYFFEKEISLKSIINKSGGLSKNALYNKKKYDNIIFNKSDTIIIPIKINYFKYKNKKILNNEIIRNLNKFVKKIHKNKKSIKLININTAENFELTTLPRIGIKTAERIIEFRKSSPFKKKEDLMKLGRIGPKTYELLKDKITVK